MKSKEKIDRKPNLEMRRMLEQLCEGFAEFWHIQDGQRVVNIYELHQAIQRWAMEKPGRNCPSQSTLARNYKGDQDNFSPATAQTLSDFFNMPKAVITGDLDLSSEAWGVDIKLPEIQWIMLMRYLTQDQRNAIYNSIRAMLPADTRVPRLPPTATPLIRPPKH